MIAHEGLRVLAFLFLGGLLFALLRIYYVAIPIFVLFLFSLFFFRDPVRRREYSLDEIVSPADGKILEILEDGDRVEVSIFMSIFDVHVNRVPYTGRVKLIEREGKKFLRAFLKEADFENVRVRTVIESPVIGSYEVIQISGIIARRIVNNLKVGEEVKTGDRMGIILYGSKVKLILPKDKVKLMVFRGQKVKAGLTVIGVVR